jgi:hypothetical protein
MRPLRKKAPIPARSLPGRTNALWEEVGENRQKLRWKRMRIRISFMGTSQNGIASEGQKSVMEIRRKHNTGGFQGYEEIQRF